MNGLFHPLADIHPEASIGEGTRIWQFCVVCAGSSIGKDCNICSHCFIERGACIGDRVTVKCGVQVWNGICLEDDVFVGANVIFTNDRHPQSGNKGFLLEKTIVSKGASIGAGAIILPGVSIGAGAVVGAGSLVVADVPAGAVVYGHPARVVSTLVGPRT